MKNIKLAKVNAARRALDFIKDGMVIGLGSGSTVNIFIKELSNFVKEKQYIVSVVPSSYDVEILAIKYGLRISTLNENPMPDIAVDGADVVDPELNLLKGGGGALTREKIVDYSSKKLIIIVDESKLKESIFVKPVPVETLPFSWRSVVEKILASYDCSIELRMCGKGKVGPVVTDNGNFILDVYFKDEQHPPSEVNVNLKLIPGVVETGIFSNKFVDAVIVGYENKVEILTR
ncbi:MAG: ribose 5-phosphate isomerase A [Thermofilum sp. ex4484_82]|nr:MAG: ribose 5-phosphate isomerase A [Thermofilum sp. ex4484_82]OYT38924.1 MAG: ribose 5-phosphate isomerase A [Archaeoglobales archaeon ex4484_92]